MTETQLQRAICDYLAYQPDIMFWRQNQSGSFYTGKDGKRKFRKPPTYAKNGVPDVIVVKDGRFIGLEVKTPKGRQSDAQKAFQEELEKNGGEYHIVRSVDDVVKLNI